jgi:threonine/homoserine/homoserine lactone efflux protein
LATEPDHSVHPPGGVVPEANTLIAFGAAAYLFALFPGPAVLYIAMRSIEQGRVAGVVSVTGIATGNLVHVVAATLGLSALVLSSAAAFTVVKYAGAAYLIYLGIREILDRDERDRQEEAAQHRGMSHLYGQGVLVATLNPKTALFFLAFLPQFVDPSRGSVTAQIALFGVLLVVITALSDTTYALLSGTVGNWFRGNARFVRKRRVFSGTMYIGLGLTAALTGSRSSNSA